MKDSILKGTGNSRFLKSAVPAGTSWADALAMLQAGTFPIDFNGINTEGFQQVGTSLNKANLLKDATAAQIGLPPSTTPDGMFQALGNTGELHVWRKTVKNAEDVPAGYTLGDVQTGNFKFVADSYRTFEFGTPSVDDAGNVGLNVEGSVNGRYNSNFNNLKGKFCRPPDSTWYIDASLGSQVIYIPADATFSQSGSYKYVDKYQIVTGYPLTPAGTTTTYPVSINPKAYQEGDDAKEAGYVLGSVVTGKHILSYQHSDLNEIHWEYSSRITVSDDGTVSLVSPSSEDIDGGDYTSVAENLIGKFARPTEDYSGFTTNVIVFFPSDATVTRDTTTYGYNAMTISKYQPVTGYAAIPAGTTIEYLGKLGDKARVQVVSYVGTGTYGSSNPNSLTFDFVPKVVMYLGANKDNGNTQSSTTKRAMFQKELTINYVSGFGFSLDSSGYPGYGKRSTNGKTFYWYTTGAARHQLNESSYIYYFLALA